MARTMEDQNRPTEAYLATKQAVQSLPAGVAQLQATLHQARLALACKPRVEPLSLIGPAICKAVCSLVLFSQQSSTQKRIAAFLEIIKLPNLSEFGINPLISCLEKQM